MTEPTTEAGKRKAYWARQSCPACVGSFGEHHPECGVLALAAAAALAALRVEVEGLIVSGSDPTKPWVEGVIYSEVADEWGITRAAVVTAIARATEADAHVHAWVDARNQVVLSGEVCTVCGAVRATEADAGEETLEEEVRRIVSTEPDWTELDAPGPGDSR